MKTTLNIDDTVMRRLREEAARRGTTMSALVEAGIRRILDEGQPAPADRESLPPLPRWRSGGMQVGASTRSGLDWIVEDE